MLLVLPTLCLPLLIGYLLFVGISGRFDPVARPSRLQDRPSWALGLWVGVTTALVSMACLYLAYQTSFSRIGTLLQPGIWLLAALLLPGLIATIAYRNTIDRILAGEARDFRNRTRKLAEVIDFPRADDRQTDVDVDVEQTSLRHALDEERRLREETEKHLRITRRALHQLEAASRDVQTVTEAVTEAVTDGAPSEGAAERAARSSVPASTDTSALEEANWRVGTEQQILDLKQEMLTSRREARRSAEAREKALAAANRSVTLARQAVASREAVEARLFEAEQLLENRQETITSLITALESEKNRTRDDVASLAKQWVLQERQQHARRSLEEVARSVEGRLTTRMARKVARARPIVPSN